MRFRFYLILLVVSGLMSDITVDGMDEPDMKISGRLISVDVNEGIIYVMHDSRLVRFRASKEICNSFREKIHSFVEIEYSKCGVKGFCINTMSIVPDENSGESDSSVFKRGIMTNAGYIH